MNYAELSWVGPDIFGRVNPSPTAFQHIADWQDRQFKERRRKEAIRVAGIKRRAAAEWAAMPEYLSPVEQARADLAALPAERRAELNAEWV